MIGKIVYLDFRDCVISENSTIFTFPYNVYSLLQNASIVCAVNLEESAVSNTFISVPIGVTMNTTTRILKCYFRAAGGAVLNVSPDNPNVLYV